MMIAAVTLFVGGMLGLVVLTYLAMVQADADAVASTTDER